MNKLTVISILLFSSVLFAQNSLNDTKFFYNSIVDASINPSNSIELNYINNSHPDDSYNAFQLRGTFNVSSDFVLGLESSDDPSSQYLTFGARYNLLQKDLRLSFGSLVDVLSNDFFISVFTSLRYLLNDDLELAGSFRIGDGPVRNKQFVEILNLGAIYYLSSKLKAIAEMKMTFEVESVYVGGGLEYNLFQNFNLRWAAFVQTDGYSSFFGVSYNF